MEVTLTIPDNCELIKNGDTYIVREKSKRPKSWEEFCKNYPVTEEDYYIDVNSIIRNALQYNYTRSEAIDRNLCTSKEEAEAFRALMQLRQLRKAWVGDWKFDKNKYVFSISYNYVLEDVQVVDQTINITCLNFPTRDMCEEFLKCFKDLCNTARILL